MRQKLCWISGEDPLFGAARNRANLLRSGSLPPVYNSYFRKLSCAHLKRLSPCIPPIRFRVYYTRVYGQNMNREVSPDLHAGLRGVIRTHEGRKGRNLLFTFGFEGRKWDAWKAKWEGWRCSLLFTFKFESLGGVIGTYEGRKHRWEVCVIPGLEQQERASSLRVTWYLWSTWGSTPLACLRATCLPKHSPLQWGFPPQLWRVPLVVSRVVLKRRCHQGRLLGSHLHMRSAFLTAGPQGETWVRLCQSHCKENERKVPESPLLAALRELQFWRPFLLPPFLEPVFGPDSETANRSC